MKLLSPARICGVAASIAALPLEATASSQILKMAAWCLLGLGVCTLLSGSLRGGFSYLLLIGLAAFLIAPFVWMVLVSLQPPKTPIPTLSQLIPRDAQGHFAPAWSNYSFVLFHKTLPVWRFFLNSVIVSFSVVVGQLLVSALAAYGFARLKFRGKEPVYWLFLLSLMFNGPVVQIPVYLMIRQFGWLDTYWALIVPGLSSAFNVFLLRQFFMQIPMELDEAARMDGAGDLRIFWRVIMPLSKPAVATAAAFTFFGVWTAFFEPLIYTNSTEMRTLEVGLSVFKNSYGSSNWPLQMTAAVIVMTPLLVAFLFLQRYFTKGLMLGSIK